MNKKFLALIITLAALQPGTSSCMFYRAEIKELDDNQEESNPEESNPEEELNLVKESNPEKELNSEKELSPVEELSPEKELNSVKAEEKVNQIEDIEEKFSVFGRRIFNLYNRDKETKRIDKGEFDEIIKLLQKIDKTHTTAIEKVKKHHKIFSDFLKEAMTNDATNLTFAFLNNKAVIDAINCTKEALPNLLRCALWLGDLNLIEPLIKLGAKADKITLDRLMSIGAWSEHENIFLCKQIIEEHYVAPKAILKAASLVVDNIDQDKIKNNTGSTGKTCMSLAKKCIKKCINIDQDKNREQFNKAYPYTELAEIFMCAAINNGNPTEIINWINKKFEKGKRSCKFKVSSLFDTAKQIIDNDKIEKSKNSAGEIFVTFAKQCLLQINSMKHDQDKKTLAKIFFQATLKNNINPAKIKELVRKHPIFYNFCSGKRGNHWNFDITGYDNNLEDLAMKLIVCDGKLFTPGAAKLLKEKNEKKDKNKEKNIVGYLSPECSKIVKVTTANSSGSSNIIRPDIKIYLADPNQD